VQILIGGLKHLQKSDNLKIYAYVILENHMYLVARSDEDIKGLLEIERML